MRLCVTAVHCGAHFTANVTALQNICTRRQGESGLWLGSLDAGLGGLPNFNGNFLEKRYIHDKI